MRALYPTTMSLTPISLGGMTSNANTLKNFIVRFLPKDHDEYDGVMVRVCDLYR